MPGDAGFHLRDFKQHGWRRKNAARKDPRWNNTRLDALVAEAVVDAYNESEQTGGFYTMMEERIILPFETEVLGTKVLVERIDMNDDEKIVAVCRKGSKRQKISILDVPLPSPLPEGAEWIAAYRHWRTGRA